MPIAEMAQEDRGHREGQEHRRARACSPAGSASAASRSLAGIRKKFAKKGAEVVRGQRARLRGRASQYAEAHPLREPRTLAAAAGAMTGASCSPTATTCAPRPRSSPAASSSAATRSRPRPRSCSSSAARSGSTAASMLQAEDEIAGIGAVRRRVVRRQEGDDRDLGPGHVAQDRDARPRHDRRAAAGLRQRAARRALDRHPDQERAVRPLPGRASRRTATWCARCWRRSTVADTFAITVEAFNIAEQYQTPVIILSDQEIAQRKETVDPIDTVGVHGRGAPAADRGASSRTTRASGSPSRASARSATRA